MGGLTARRLLPAALTLLCAVSLVAAPNASALSSVPDQPGYDVNGTVFAIARMGDTIYIGGSFTTVNGLSRTNLAAISAADGSVTPWAPTTDNTVRAIVASGSTIYVGGLFGSVGDSAGAHPRNALAAFDTAGNALGWDPNAGLGASVYGLALDRGRMYVGGQFGSLGPPGGAINESNLGVVDPAGAGLPLGWATNPPNPSAVVNTLGVSPDGTILYVGGNFGQIGSPVAVNRLGVAAVRTSDGVVDPNWDPADPAGGGFIDDLEVGPNGTLYLVGDFFPNIPGQNSMGFAERWYAAEVQPAGNGATGAATAFAPDADSEAFAITLGVDGVYLGGTFGHLNANGTRPPQIRVNAGSADYGTGDVQPWDPAPNNDVSVLFAASDGSVYMGGSFSTLGSGAGNGFASFSPPPTSTAAPAIQGTPQPGQTVTCTQGTWLGALPQTYATQLLLDGAAIGPAGATDYAVQPADVGHTIGCTVTAHNRTADVTAAATPVTVAALPVVPVVTPPSGLARPVYRKSANVYPQKGTVLVELPGTKSFVPLSVPEQIPFGSVIDARRGTVRICTADARGKVECSDFYGGMFKLTQLRGRPPITVLTLVGGNFKKCPRAKARRSLAEAAKKPRSIRHLWGSGSGHFRTVGRFASATIRGTTWLTDDRCDGTLIRVRKGAVTVRDRVKGKSLALRAPRQYLAKAGKRRA